ncbi:MAG: TolC family protein [Phycisphaerae bacterium]|nr:TolC family protein [Phycisphaerae bacterium]
MNSRLRNFRPVMTGVVCFCSAAGCQGPDTTSQYQKAAEWVESRTGIVPDWESPWDETANGLRQVVMLDPETVIATALRNNRALRADLEFIGQADAELVQAGLMSNPVFNFMMMFPSGGGRVMLRGGALPMQPLQDLWLIPVRRKVASAALQEAVLRSADRAVDTVKAAKTAYVEVQYAQRAIELIRENIELVSESTSIIQARSQAGQSSQVEVNLSRIREERLQSERLAMQTELAEKKYQLLALMGAADAPVSWAVRPLQEIADRSPPPRDEVELVLLASDQRLDLKSAEWVAESALSKVKLARREGWPDLALGFTFERSPRGRTRGASLRARASDAAASGFVRGLSNGMNGGRGMQQMGPPVSQIAPMPRPTRDVTYTLGPMIEFELPIFDWGQAQTARAIHEYRQRLASYDDLLQSIVKDVRTLLARQVDAYGQLRLFRDVIMPEVERNLELARESYISGQTDLTIYLRTQEDAIATRQKMLEFLRDCLLIEAELERAVGGAMGIARMDQGERSNVADGGDRVEDNEVTDDGE